MSKIWIVGHQTLFFFCSSRNCIPGTTYGVCVDGLLADGRGDIDGYGCTAPSVLVDLVLRGAIVNSTKYC